MCHDNERTLVAMTDHNPELPLSDGVADPAASSSTDDEARFQRVSDALKVGFQALGSADIPPEDKGAWHKRLIAITNSSKHDLATAEGRLDRFWTDWEDTVGPPPADARG